MSLTRWIVVAVITLALGAAGGAVVAKQRLGAQLAQLSADRDKAAADMAALAKKNQDIASKESALESENKMLKEQLAASKIPVTQQPAPAFENVADPGDGLGTAAPAQDDAALNRQRRNRRGGDPNTPETPEEQAKRQQEREQRTADFKNRMTDFFNGEMQKTNDPAAQQRISQIGEATQAMMDLRRQLRDAKTDDERKAIQQQIQDQGTATHSLVVEQQEFMMRQALTSSGITDPSAQEATMNQMKDVLQSPFFRFPMGGGGPGGPGGGQGGPGGGSGGFFGGFGGGRGGQGGGGGGGQRGGQ